MDRLLDWVTNAFGNYPFESILILFLLTLWSVMFFDYRTMKYNQIQKQVSSRIGKETEEKKKFSITELGLERIKKQEEKIKTEIERANVLFTVQEYFNFMTFGMLIGAALGMILYPLGVIWTAFMSWLPGTALDAIFGRVLAGSVFAYVGYIFPRVWLLFLISRRKKLLGQQITDALLNIADALKSGHVIQDAIKTVGEEMSYPIGPEFAKAFNEMEAGKTLNAALHDLKKRINLPDFDMAVNAIVIQFEVGGRLEPLLRNMVKIINERQELKREIQKTISGSKTVGYILLAAPILFTAIFTMMSKDTYLLMLSSGIGIIMLILAIVCYGIAAFFIFYIIRDVSKEV